MMSPTTTPNVFLDLLFTSEGVVRLTLVGAVVFVLFVLFGPAPVDERKLDLDKQWAKHHARGTIFHQKTEKKNEADELSSSSKKTK
mmetsp:Transcript_10329/g.34129  ORF Transcript_10329/g.34129 Transcript_10329/m.34129 type:complete len:86 (+) Transcript_10329:153-410(+)